MIALCPQGLYVIHYADKKGCLAVFTCNGQQLYYKSLDEPALVSPFIVYQLHSSVLYFVWLVCQSLFVYSLCPLSVCLLVISHLHVTHLFSLGNDHFIRWSIYYNWWF